MSKTEYFDFKNQLFEGFVSNNFMPNSPESPMAGGKKASVFLKLADIFLKGPKEFPDFCPVFEYQEGLWTETDKSNTGYGQENQESTWSQSCFLFKIPKGPYLPILRNYTASKINIPKAQLIETGNLGSSKNAILTSYAFSNSILEGIWADAKVLKLLLKPKVVRVETHEIDPQKLTNVGKKVSQLNIQEHTVD